MTFYLLLAGCYLLILAIGLKFGKFMKQTDDAIEEMRRK